MANPTLGPWDELKRRAEENARVLATQLPSDDDTPPAVRQARQWLRDCDFEPKYAERYKPAETFHDEPSECQFITWLEDLPRMLHDGGWLIMGGEVGTRKSFALARIADFAQALTVCKGEGWVPRQLIPGSEIVYYFAPQLQGALLSWDGDCADEPGYMSRLLKARVLLVDDVDRWMELRGGDFQLGKMLSRWDTLMEYRDQPRLVTVVTANCWAGDLYEQTEFRRWIDRARERGVCIDIHGTSTRGERGNGADA